MVRKVKFDSAYTFVYSRRTGTPAAAMEDQVEPSVVKERFGRLLEVIKKSSKDNRKEGIGKEEDVLVEEKIPTRAAWSPAGFPTIS